MRKIIKSITFLACVLGLASCGMKECYCFSTNVITQNDSLIQNTTDWVENFTRGDCEDFNRENEVLQMDSVTFVKHSVICSQYPLYPNWSKRPR